MISEFEEKKQSKILNQQDEKQKIQKKLKVFSEDIIASEEYPSSLVQSLTCPICLMILPIPHYQCSQCDNQFCIDCLDKWKTKSLNQCIFKCQNATFKFVKRSNTYNAMIELLKTKCKKCNQILSLSKFMSHESKQCPQITINCQNQGCKIQLKRKNIKQHIQSCQYNLIQCQYCHRNFPRIKLNNHQNFCQEKVIKCPNEKCIQVCKIINYDQHIKICPFQQMQCHWCNLKVLRKNKQQHQTNCQKRQIQCIWCKIKFFLIQYLNHQNQCKQKTQHCQLCQKQVFSINKIIHRQQCVFQNLIKLKQQNKKLRNLNNKLQSKVNSLEEFIHKALQNRQDQTVKTLSEMKEAEKKQLLKDLQRIQYSLKSVQKLKKQETQSHAKLPHFSYSWCPVCKSFEKKFKDMLQPLISKKKQLNQRLQQIKRFNMNLSKIHQN